MISQNIEQDFDEIARAAWESHKTFLERMYDCWVGEGQWEPSPPQVTYRLYDPETGVPIPGHICDSTDKWVVEGDEASQVTPVFVCEHEPIWAGRGSIRQISSVPVHQVGRIEETSRPLE